MLSTLVESRECCVNCTKQLLIRRVCALFYFIKYNYVLILIRFVCQRSMTLSRYIFYMLLDFLGIEMKPRTLTEFLA